MEEENNCYSQDVLARKGAEFFYKILDGINASVLITDVLAPDNPIVFVNKTFEVITGYRRTEAMGRNCRFLQGSDRDQPGRNVLACAIARGESCESTLRNYRKNGEMFWNQIYIFPLRDHYGSITHFVGVQHDVTLVRSAQSSLEDKRILIENSIDAYLKLGSDGTILEANHAVLRIFGWKPEELVGTSAFLVIPDARVEDAKKEFMEVFSQQASRSVTRDYKRKDGNAVIVEWTLTTGHDRNSIVCIGRDITERHRIENEVARANERTHEFLNSIAEGFCSIDRQWRFTYVNAQGAKWLRRQAEDLIGKNLWEEFPETIETPFSYACHQAMDFNAYTQSETYDAPLEAWFEARAYPSAEGITLFFMDISDRKKNEEKLIYSATHDSLTGLMNRNSFLKIINERLAASNTGGKSVALLFIDLDRFKEINDAFGHSVGDRVLTVLGQRLAGMANDNRMPARISGDEFLFLLQETAVDDARRFAENVLKSIVEPLRVSGVEVAVGASIGIAIAGDSPIAADDLVNRADTAMYAAKAAGRQTVSVFSEEIDRWSKRRLQLRHEILPALHAGQFVLHYQPQLRLVDDEVIGAEALVRWQHPQFGLLNPAAFIDLAEESPVIIRLGAWIFDEACRQLAEWEKSGRQLTMSINVSARQLSDPDLPYVMERSIQKHGIKTDCIKLEVTESMLAQDLQVSANVLERLKQKGFGIALDDFGTGYSNLAYINRFPVTAIKIDRSFIIDIENDNGALDLVNGIIALAKSLKLAVICEGIETQAQRRILSLTQCDSIQGYLVSRPVPAHEFIAAS